MGWNENDHPRNQHNGQWVDKTGMAGADDLDETPQIPGLMTMSREGLRMDDTPYDASMRALADHTVTVTDRGVLLPDGTPLDPQAIMDHPEGRMVARQILRNGLPGVKATQRRALAKAAFKVASPRDRRQAIDQSDLVQYFPADRVAASLQRRRDPEKASAILDRVHALNKNASANIIRRGFPNSKRTAFLFINRHKEQDQGVGTAARWYLRVKYGSPNGAPSDKEMRTLNAQMRRLKDDPAGQAALFWKVAYGPEPWERGNGYAATMVAWGNTMSSDAAQEFLSMARGDERHAKSQYHPEQKRLTAMRAMMHALYPEVKNPDEGSKLTEEERAERDREERRIYRA